MESALGFTNPERTSSLDNRCGKTPNQPNMIETCKDQTGDQVIVR
jgi:hypothetical protein